MNGGLQSVVHGSGVKSEHLTQTSFEYVNARKPTKYLHLSQLLFSQLGLTPRLLHWGSQPRHQFGSSLLELFLGKHHRQVDVFYQTLHRYVGFTHSCGGQRLLRFLRKVIWSHVTSQKLHLHCNLRFQFLRLAGTESILEFFWLHLKKKKRPVALINFNIQKVSIHSSKNRFHQKTCILPHFGKKAFHFEMLFVNMQSSVLVLSWRRKL